MQSSGQGHVGRKQMEEWLLHHQIEFGEELGKERDSQGPRMPLDGGDELTESEEDVAVGEFVEETSHRTADLSLLG